MTQFKVKPIRNDVLVHPIDDPDRTSGKIHVPDSVKRSRRTKQGIAVSLGPDCHGDISPGDHVLFNPYSGDKVALQTGGIFYFVPESHIVCVIQESDVVLMDTETMKRIISERFGELMSKFQGDEYSEEGRRLYSIEASLIDRIDSITIAEGFEW